MDQPVLDNAARTPAPRSGQEKVAILLLSLGEELGGALLRKFDAQDVRAIMASASGLGSVSKDDLDHLVDDFAARFARAIGLGTDFESMRSLIEKAFAPTELAQVLGDGPSAVSEPVWQQLANASEHALVPYLLDEHPQTVAFVLSRLDPDFAARCLSILPGDFRMTVARRLLRMLPVGREAEAIVEDAIREDLLAKGGRNVEAEGRARLAAMLNRLDREQSGSILAALAAWRPEEAAQLQRMIFAFEDIGKLSQQARLAVFDRLQTEQVIAALRGMPAGLREVVLSALGARARRMVEAELAGDTGQKTPEGDAARKAIAALVLDMARKGEIELPAGDTAAGP